jgi:amylosucrase
VAVTLSGISSHQRALVVVNFDANPQYLELDVISTKCINPYAQFTDLYCGNKPTQFDRRVILQALNFPG